MKEFVIKVSFVVDARDEEEAIRIARSAREAIERQPYMVRDLETDSIREL